ncbi:MAG: hypothetical protein AVDCRST_MAG73-2815, partial [uncultured Thermomicrobiales bacterium]
GDRSRASTARSIGRSPVRPHDRAPRHRRSRHLGRVHRHGRRLDGRRRHQLGTPPRRAHGLDLRRHVSRDGQRGPHSSDDHAADPQRARRPGRGNADHAPRRHAVGATSAVRAGGRCRLVLAGRRDGRGSDPAPVPAPVPPPRAGRMGLALGRDQPRLAPPARPAGRIDRPAPGRERDPLRRGDPRRAGPHLRLRRRGPHPRQVRPRRARRTRRARRPVAVFRRRGVVGSAGGHRPRPDRQHRHRVQRGRRRRRLRPGHHRHQSPALGMAGDRRLRRARPLGTVDRSDRPLCAARGGARAPVRLQRPRSPAIRHRPRPPRQLQRQQLPLGRPLRRRRPLPRPVRSRHLAPRPPV